MSLFTEPLQIEKVSYKRVSENPTNWTRDIMEEFFNEFPYFINYPAHVDFKQRDDQKGYAIATIHVDQLALDIPVIIQNRELFPFDIAFFQGQIMPLRPATIEMFIENKDPFFKTTTREIGDYTSNIFNAGAMGYVREMPMEMYKASEFKDAPEMLLDKVLTSITQQEKLAALNTLDEHIAESYIRHHTARHILKIASTYPKQQFEKLAETAIDMLPKDIWYIYRSAPFSYHGYAANSSTSDSVVEGEFTQPEIDKLGGHFVKTSSVKTAEKAKQPVAKGLVRTKTGRAVLLDNNNYATMPEDRFTDANAYLTETPPTVNEVESGTIGKYAMFELENNTYSDPVKITHDWYDKNTRIFEGLEGLQKVAYCPFTGIEKPYTENGITYIPKTAKIILANDRDEVADLNYTIPAHRIIRSGTEYIAEGPVFKKLGAYKPQSKDEAIWLLVRAGGTDTDVNQLMKLADAKSLYINTELRYPKYSVAELIKTAEAKEAEVTEQLKTLAQNFVKEAAALPDTPTVDKVLALHFVNKDTIQSFIDALPVLEQSMFDLADLLLKIRMGTQLLDEQAVRKVMLGLVDIVQVLKGAKSLKKTGK
jgi:hypothetical protein